MAIFAHRKSRLLLQGLKSSLARFQCAEILKHGTALRGIVAHKEELLDFALPQSLPIYSDLGAAEGLDADIALLFSNPLEAKQQILDALDHGVRIVVSFSDGVPIWDAIEVCEYANKVGAILLGPNSSGFLSPGIIKAGFYVEDITKPGRVGVVSKSGSLSYAVIAEMKSHGVGVSTVVAIGGDSVRGIGFSGIMALFERDPHTEAVVLLGEIGGDEEERAAAFIAKNMSKPVVAFVSGKSIPKGVSMGHAGAIAKEGEGDYQSKVSHLQSAGAIVARDIGGIAYALKEIGVK